MLKLTAADELVALENMSVLQQSGFEVALEEAQLAGRRPRLVAQPVSKNAKFDIQGAYRAFSYCLTRRLTWRAVPLAGGGRIRF